MPRPRSITLLALALAALAAFNLLGAAGAIRRYTWLSELGLSLPPAYLVATRALAGLVFAPLAAGLWRRQPWARTGTLIALPVYVIIGWIERLGFMRSDYARVSSPYHAALHIVVLAFVGWALLRRPARAAFELPPGAAR